MNRLSQNLVLLLLGGALLRISAFSTTYVNYVKPGFRPFLIAAGVAVFAVGVIGLVQAWRKPDEEHAHHGPRVAWLLCLPVLAVFLIAPPALGSFAAARSDTPPPPPKSIDAFQPLKGEAPISMTMGEFIGRAWREGKNTLAGHTVRLTGFVTPSKKKGQWYVTRMQLSCCAADAYALKVAVHGLREPEQDTWVEVTGRWIPPKSAEMPNGVIWADLEGAGIKVIEAPAEPYE